jgi:hypothetical protein
VRTDPPPALWPGRAAFEQGITLEYAPPSLTGNTLRLNLRWQTAAPIEHALKVFVHLRQPGSESIAQSDSEPAGGFDPTDDWRPDQPILDRRALLVPRNASPGTYAVYVGLYTAESGTRLHVQSPEASDEPESVLVGHVDLVGRSN